MVETEHQLVEHSGESTLDRPRQSTILFRGRGEYGIDDKGRLTLPAHMRQALADGGGDLAVLDGRAVIWTEATFRDAVAHLESLVDDLTLTQQQVRAFTSSAHPVSPDSQGRIVIPHTVRIEAGLDGQIVILGAGSRIELVPAGSEDLETLFGVDDQVVDALDRAKF